MRSSAMTQPKLPRPQDDGPLVYYEALESASRDMLAAARSGHWDRVAQIEHAAGRLIAQLRSRLTDGVLDARDARVRLLILRRIVENDAQVRQLAQPRLHEPDALPRPERHRLH